MAAEYRFLDTANNVDAFVVTDHVRNAENFFVTDLRNYGSTDIIAGIELEVQEYTELELITMAMDHDVALYRSMDGFEECLVQPGVLAGQFNGTTSVITFDNVPIASSGVVTAPLVIGCTFRFTDAQIEDLIMRNAMAGIFGSLGTEDTHINVKFFFAPGEEGEGEGEGGEGGVFGLDINATLNSTIIFDVTEPLTGPVTNRCFEFELRFSNEPTNSMMEIILNGDTIDVLTHPDQLASTDDTINLSYGIAYEDGTIDSRMNGIMRDLFVTTGTVSQIDVPDPSTGTNAGALGDGTVTDIDQVTVIV